MHCIIQSSSIKEAKMQIESLELPADHVIRIVVEPKERYDSEFTRMMRAIERRLKKNTDHSEDIGRNDIDRITELQEKIKKQIAK